MSLDRIIEVPSFRHRIDDYELSRMDATDAYIARKNSELQQAIDWNNEKTVQINNAVVDQNDEIDKVKTSLDTIKARLDDWDVRYKVLVARVKSPFVIIGAVITLFGPAILSWFLEHYFSKK